MFCRFMNLSKIMCKWFYFIYLFILNGRAWMAPKLTWVKFQVWNKFERMKYMLLNSSSAQGPRCGHFVFVSYWLRQTCHIISLFKIDSGMNTKHAQYTYAIKLKCNVRQGTSSSNVTESVLWNMNSFLLFDFSVTVSFFFFFYNSVLNVLAVVTW